MEIVDKFYNYIKENEDPRIKDYFLMQSPGIVLIIVMCYVVFVKYLGPKLMEKRKPYDLSKVLIAYNLVQIILSVIMFYNISTLAWFNDYNWLCEPLNREMSPKQIAIANCCYMYLINKFIEFLDTIFFVLRKKSNQITNLHVFHHSILPIVSWLGVKMSPGGKFVVIQVKSSNLRF